MSRFNFSFKDRRLNIYGNSQLIEKFLIFLSELGGTTILVFLGCTGCLTVEEGINSSLTQIAFAFGFAVLIAVQIFGHISGAHINPAVTTASLIMGNTPLILVPFYFAGQFIGGLAGYGLIKAITPKEFLNNSSNAGLCSPNPNSNLTDIQVLITEFLLTLFLVWVICSIWDNRSSDKQESVAIKIGLTVAGLAFSGANFSGAHMNPARTFGPSLINGVWNYQWIYWVGPFAAGIFGGLTYRLIFHRSSASVDISGVVTDNNR